MIFQKFTKFNLLFGTLAVVSYLTLAVFLPLLMTGMNHYESGMGNCLFAIGEAAICEISLFGHIIHWQTMATAIPANLFVLLLFLAAIFFTFGIFRRLFDPPYPILNSYRSAEPQRPLFRFLLLGSALSPRAP